MHCGRQFLGIESAPTLPPTITLPSRDAATVDATTLLSIVIPTYDEVGSIRATILAALSDEHVEVIVMDGGSTDGTCAIAADAGAHHVGVYSGDAPSSRAACQNSGADIATGPILLFLHGDTLLPNGYGRWVRDALANPKFDMAAFKLVLHPRLVGIGLVELGANLRSEYRQLPYGDQALCMRRETFAAMGKFQEQMMLEDLELVYTVRRNGGTILTLPASVISSSRRWTLHGIIGNTLRNQFVLIGHAVGVPLPKIASWYYGQDGRKKY